MSHHDDAPAERARVRARIGAVLTRLWRAGLGREFAFADMLPEVVAEVGPVDPDSPRRIASLLRAERVLHYESVRRGLFRWEPVPPLPQPVQRSLFGEARA